MKAKGDKPRITFDEVRAGDLLRVRYSEGAGNTSLIPGNSSANANAACVGVTRVMVTTPHLKALDTIWLNEKGYPVVHRDWEDLDIILLKGEEREFSLTPKPKERKVREGGWTPESVEMLNEMWELPIKEIAEKLGRTEKAVSSKRRNLRKKGYPKVKAKV